MPSRERKRAHARTEGLRHTLSQCVVLAGSMSIYYNQFLLPREFFLAMLITYCVALAGAASGLLISSLTESETSAIQIGLAHVFLLLSLSGVLWPLLSAPAWLSWLSYVSPVTYAAADIRSVVTRGWTVDRVWRNFVASLLWASACIAVVSIMMRVQQRKRVWLASAKRDQLKV